MNEIEEFWKMIHSGDEELREEGFDKWIEFDNKNPLHFENMKERFSKQFYETYEDLHDFLILDVEIIRNRNQSKETDIKLLIGGYAKHKSFNVVYHNVKEYIFNIPDTSDEMSWYGDIFEEVEENMLKYRIKLIGDMYIEIVCKSVDMIKVDLLG